MSLVPILATPAAIAFGGVPTGVWNAIEHDSAAGNIRYNGCTFIANAISAKTGSITFATATFDANSVKTCANRQIRNNSNKNGSVCRPARYVPSIADMPDSLPPRANANPPPSRKIKLHGTLAFTYFHVMRAGVVAFGRSSGFPLNIFSQPQLDGSMNKAITMKMAGVASPTLTFVINSAQPVIKPVIGEHELAFAFNHVFEHTKMDNYLVLAGRTMQRTVKRVWQR